MIKFGTSGWRAVMGEEFTFENVRTVVQAVANYLKRKFPGQPIAVVVNYDTRFLSDRYALEAAKVLSHNQIHVYLTDRDAPSQAEAYQIIKRRAQGGINFTASFNPPEYNGFKFNTETGAPALPEVTKEIEANVRALQRRPAFLRPYSKDDQISKIDLQADYLRLLQERIDFETIRKAKIRVGVDLLYGTSREYLDEILEENEVPIEEIHGYVDPYFGGVTPSCTEENLAELKRLVKEKGCSLGVATDADGDRFGVVDQAGRFVIQNLILALLLDYVVSRKGWRGGVGRSVTTTHLLDRVARRYGLPLYKTPVGFKYLAPLVIEKKIIFGGEESASLGIKDHLPEKDGIVAGLLVAEMIAATGKNLSELKICLFREYGKKIDGQVNLPLTLDREIKLAGLIKNPPHRVGARKVVGLERIDGLKLDLSDDDWVLLRRSGTEPLIRCYAEADSKKELDKLIKSGLELLD